MIKSNLFEFDKDFNKLIIGTDEAGRGSGAGGVFAGAVHFTNPDGKLIKKLSYLDDSKKLSKTTREELYKIILENSINATVCIEVDEIEKINILNASLKAMKLAVETVLNEIQIYKQAKQNSSPLSLLTFHPLILVDGNKLIKDFNFSAVRPLSHSAAIHQKCIIKGDSKSASIAAASILAKVSRDRYMTELHEKFPQYNWSQNAGYLTKEHLSAIDKYGTTPIHRMKFLRKHREKCIKQLSMFQK